MGHCYSAVCYISDSLSTAVCYTNDPLSTTVCYTSDPLSIAVCYTSDPLSIPVIPMTPVTVVISMTPCPQLLCVCMVRGVGQCCLFTSDLLSTAAVWVYGEVWDSAVCLPVISCPQLLCGCMEKGLRQLRISLVSLEVGRGLVMLHMLVEQMRPRLQAILDMANVRPGAAQALRAGATGPCSELLNTPDEMVFCCSP